MKKPNLKSGLLFAALVLALSSGFFTTPASATSTKEDGGTIAADPFNSRLAIQVAQDGTFNIGAFPDPATGSATSNSWDLMYRWPDSPGTSFTTFRIDEADFIYGESGTQTKAPTDIDATTNQSIWQIGDIEVTQILKIVHNNQTNEEDAAQILYIVRNTGTTTHSIGSRIMIDTELNYNDGAPFRVPGDGIITAEKEYLGSSVPDTFTAFFDLTDNTHVAAATLKSDGVAAPDRLILAQWPALSGTNYDYTITSKASFTADSAYALYWNPAPLAAGESRSYITYYGIAQLQADLRPPLALGITGPATLSVINNTYSPNPFTITATVFNNGLAPAENVAITLDLPPELSLVSSTQTQNIGSLSVGEERQVSWDVQAANQSSEKTTTYSVEATALNTDTKTVTKQIILPALPQSTTTTLTVIKEVVNDDGGDKVVSDFPLLIIIGGSDAEIFPRPISGVPKQLKAGTYRVIEFGSSEYAASFSGDCDASGSITLAPGDNKICTITNDDVTSAITRLSLSQSSVSHPDGIPEGSSIIDSSVTFTGRMDDPNNRVPFFLQVELREFNEPFTGPRNDSSDTGGILTSNPVAAGSVATITRFGLVPGAYHWRARALDASDTPPPDWTEFGTVGNIDFQIVNAPPPGPDSHTYYLGAIPDTFTGFTKDMSQTTTPKKADGSCVQPLNEVKYLQTVLVEDGQTEDGSSVYPESIVNGCFGPLTEKAVKNFQSKYGLEPTGKVDSDAIRSQLNMSLEKMRRSVSSSGDRMQSIKKSIQSLLTDAKFNFPKEYVLGIAHQESGDIYNFNNEHVSGDDGRGIMQVTDSPSVGADAPAGCKGIKDENEKIIVTKEDCYKYYANTRKGVENNIRDGMKVLKDKYIAANDKRSALSDITYQDVPYKVDDLINISTLSRYNGSLRQAQAIYLVYTGSKPEQIKDYFGEHNFNLSSNVLRRRFDNESWLESIRNACASETSFNRCLKKTRDTKVNNEPLTASVLYLQGIANHLDEISSDYFTEGNTLREIEKKQLITADNTEVITWLLSPAELKIRNADNHITGIVAGEIHEDVPNSIYDDTTGGITLLFPQSDDHYEVTGTTTGTYRLVISNLGTDKTFQLQNVPTSTSTVHTYTVDWQALEQDQPGVKLEIDQNGDGQVDQSVQIGSGYFDTIAPTTTATVVGVVGANGWYVDTTSVTFTAEDNTGGVGVEKTEYSLDGGQTWNLYASTSPLIIAVEGTTTVTYRSVDYFGNTEANKNLVVEIVSVKWFLEDALAKLKSINTDNKNIDKAADAVEKDLDKIIADKSWLDRNRLSWPKGASVLIKEVNAIRGLRNILRRAGQRKNNIPAATQAIYRDAQSEIVQSSALLAKLSFDKAKAIHAKNASGQKALDKAIVRIQKMLDRAAAKESKKPNQAARLYGAAWFASEALLKSSGTTLWRASDFGGLYSAGDMKDLVD